MLQRSWTVEQSRGEDVAGAVYVGRASFRMGGTPLTSLPTVIVDQAAVPAEAAPIADPGRMPTERIVLAPPSADTAASVTSFEGARPRRMMFLFGSAFAVGVLCTVAGQTVLGGARADAPASVRAVVAETTRVEPVTAPVVVMGDSAPRGTATAASPDSQPAIEASLADATGDSSPSLDSESAGTTVARSHAVAHARAGRRVLRPTASSEGKSVRRADLGATAKWVDPFAAGDDAASDVTEAKSTKGLTRVNGSNTKMKSTASAKGAAWVDPFAE